MYRLLCISLLFFAMPAYAAEICDRQPIIDLCFQVQGKIQVFANSRPYLTRASDDHRYWIGETSDSTDADYLMPADLQQRIGNLETVKGTFEVCPLEKFHKGQMQKICLQSFKD